jgi:hypothetical protein
LQLSQTIQWQKDYKYFYTGVLVIKFLLIFILILLFNPQLNAQSEFYSTVSGFVYDSSNGEALIGASVYFENSNIGATSNVGGYFVIPNAPLGNQTLVISYLSYKTLIKKITVQKEANEIQKINLEPSFIQTREVIVAGDSTGTIEKLFIKPISKIELTASQINNIPRVIEADLLRSLFTLPGIQPLSDFSSALYVRGGTPDQNLYLVDGTDVYNPEHAFGIFSNFNTNAIKKIELSKGGFGAEYGGRLSSILSVTNIDGNRNSFQGDLSISLLSGALTLQTPISNFGSISGSFRRTYLDQTVAKFVDEVPPYYFYDGNLKAYFDLDDADKLTFSLFGSKDNLDYTFDKKAKENVGFHYDWGNLTSSINWKLIITQKLFANFWFTGSKYSSLFTFDEAGMKEKNKIIDYTLKGNLEYYYSGNFAFKFGYEYKNVYGMLLENFPSGIVDAKRYINYYSGYTTINWKPTGSWNIEAGLRYDYFSSQKDYKNLDPRLSIKFRLTESSNLKFSTGIYHQYVNRMPRLFFASIWTSADKYTTGSSSYHYILAYQREIGQIYSLEIEAYFKDYKNIYQFNQTFQTEVQADSYTEDNKPVYSESRGLYNRGDGMSYGIEFQLNKVYGAITGWFGYSLARTEYKFDGLNHDKSFIPKHDRTSTINCVANIDINNFLDEIYNETYSSGKSKWIVGFNFIYATGQPITMPSSLYSMARLPDWGDVSYSYYPSELNTVRLPPYIRMDISITYKKHYKGWSLEPYIQVYNIGNRKNTWFIQYEYDFDNDRLIQDIKTMNMFPILPSIGVNIKF